MEWGVEYTDEFGEWWDRLSEAEQEDVVELLEKKGPQLPYPHSSGINGSKHAHMRELRIQHAGRPYRTLYAFDPRRMAILLIGGDKTGNNRWYEENIPVADRLYGEHIESLEREKRKLMARKFKDLRKAMSPEAQARSHAKAIDMMAELPLAELRQARHFSQEQLAEILEVKQPAVAKMEKKVDMYISTLRRFVEAMGGELEINAHFPEGNVRINQFEDLEDKQQPAA